MLYATNGTVQDLPQGTQFAFWDNQFDWGRAFKIAKIQQQFVEGVTVAPHLEVEDHTLLELVQNDPCKAFISRPVSQVVDWIQWARFCKWFFRLNRAAREEVMNQMRWGNCGYWLGQFLASGTMADEEGCFTTAAKVDAIVFWDFHEWDYGRCRSKQKLLDHWPTPDEIAQYQEFGDWLTSVFGESETKRLADSPPTASQRANVVSSSASPPPEITETGTVSEATTTPYIVGIGVLAFGAAWLLWTKSR